MPEAADLIDPPEARIAPRWLTGGGSVLPSPVSRLRQKWPLICPRLRGSRTPWADRAGREYVRMGYMIFWKPDAPSEPNMGRPRAAGKRPGEMHAIA